ncbi:MAG: hypothetical protein R2695_03965 [Acidimicrobiales bacterium]
MRRLGRDEIDADDLPPHDLYFDDVTWAEVRLIDRDHWAGRDRRSRLPARHLARANQQVVVAASHRPARMVAAS